VAAKISHHLKHRRPATSVHVYFRPFVVLDSDKPVYHSVKINALLGPEFLTEYGWFKRNRSQRTHTVGLLEPNASHPYFIAFA
jgi:hypothetical protein